MAMPAMAIPMPRPILAPELIPSLLEAATLVDCAVAEIIGEDGDVDEAIAIVDVGCARPRVVACARSVERMLNWVLLSSQSKESGSSSNQQGTPLIQSSTTS